MKKAIPFLKRLSVSLLIFLLAGEIAIRLYLALSAHDIHRATAAKDNLLGWKAKAHFETKFETKDQLKQPYPVHYQTVQHGFRFYGDPHTDRKKAFFLGDSFTQAAEVSDTSTFYHHLCKKLNFECFAYGMSGFGTLQEFLFLQQHIDSIQPDVFILQMCTNDFIDNHHELALACMYEMHEKRSYLQADGKIVHQIPLSCFRQFLQYLKFPEFVYKRIRRILLTQGKIDVGESKISAQKLNYPLFAEAVERTEFLVQKIMTLLPEGTQLVIFCADAYEPQHETIRKLANRNNLPFVEGHIHALREAEGLGKAPFHRDGVHWSPEGHRVVAEELATNIWGNF
jgi:lysophospholipase L1-like esterase